MIARYGKERVKRGLIHFFIGKSVSALGGFCAMLLVVHALSISDFAKYSVLVALVEVFTALSGFGIAHMFLRYVPELYVKFQSKALRSLILFGLGFRSGVLVLLLLLAWVCSGYLSAWIGLADAVSIFNMFLVVVAFRSTNQFLSMILESTLHQGIAQSAFSIIAVLRCIGMLWLIHDYPQQVALVDVIWVEAIAECIAMLIMLLGIGSVLWQRKVADEPEADWFAANRDQLITFSKAAYFQHLATLPFGANTNRLVGGAMFGEHLMAKFGFANSLYEYIKRYLPTQLLIGLIRPVVVARFSTTRNFTVAARLCEQSLQVNLALLAGFLAVMMVSGREILLLISAGKYGAAGISVSVLSTLLVLLVFETQRVILEMLTQMVERYEVMIPSNIFLSFSVLGGIAAFPIMGVVALPMANILALVLANYWVARRLAILGFQYQHDWKASIESLVMLVVSVATGKLFLYLGANWVLALVVTLGMYSLMFVKVKLPASMQFARELIGNRG